MTRRRHASGVAPRGPRAALAPLFDSVEQCVAGRGLRRRSSTDREPSTPVSRPLASRCRTLCNLSAPRRRHFPGHCAGASLKHGRSHRGDFPVAEVSSTLFPRSLCRGLIEARRRGSVKPATLRHFPGHCAGASLKLMPCRRRAAFSADQDFPGHCAGASLKQRSGPMAAGLIGPRFPRSSCRGLY